MVDIFQKTEYIVFMVTALEVKKMMDERGLKTAWVADKIGVKPKTLNAFLSGGSNLGKPAQILLCQILDIKIKSEAC